jgi:RND family efflux transporter MFP subunit
MQIITKKSLITVVGFASIFLAISINGALSANQEKAQPVKVVPQNPVVSVVEVEPITHQASVVSYGEVKSRNELELTSQVSGKITYLSPKFLTGNSFKKGELLAQVEPIVYQQALANAQLTLANARLALAQEELTSDQAAQEWQQSGLANERPSDLVLRKPQLAVAKAQYNLAVKELAQAEYNLAKTKIVAPFDALIVTKQVQMGSNVQSGTIISKLYDTNLFEVSLPLSVQQWKLLPTNSADNLSNIYITFSDEANQATWTAKAERVEKHLDSASRQRSLVATIKQPISLDTPLFPGTFVKATINGEAISKLWKLPASALIDSNTVWQVNEQGLLNYLTVTVAFSQDDDIYVKPVNDLTQASIVKRPLSSYLANMKVEAKIEAQDTASDEIAQLNTEELL